VTPRDRVTPRAAPPVGCPRPVWVGRVTAGAVGQTGGMAAAAHGVNRVKALDCAAPGTDLAGILP